MAVDYTNAILTLASRAGGICTRKTLLAEGVSKRVIERRLQSGLLARVGDGVYAMPALAGPLTELYRATLSVPQSAVSRSSCAHELRFDRAAVGVAAGRPVHVTAPHGASRSVPGVIVHETRLMHEADIVELAPGLPGTSPARTVVDLAGQLSTRRLRHLVQLQVRAGRPTAVELHACFEALRRRGLPGVDRLDRILIELFAVEPVGRSELESRVLAALRAAGISGFQEQFRPPWYDGRRGVVDFAHSPLGIVLEADGRRWHETTQASVEDHRRDRLAAAHGWVTIRVGWSEIVDRPAATMAEIAAIMAERRSLRRTAG
ncbi:MAG: type IV toxin-antitoxin system AbiEi family antitoxin domain-containing protein [Acidimicrobiia bacterium]|nr:type IV toxin-antitoxin system AbiEi family antitoxin domain-containing protein [Acidimicrobiia bacterium]MDH5519792.1 type IV toxin-antitoxin system AbiEi family antitoxin domain-containing protein [Acidimicrobiia bacterium]